MSTAVKAVYEPKSVSPSTRVDQFPGEELTVSNGVLFLFGLQRTSILEKEYCKASY